MQHYLGYPDHGTLIRTNNQYRNNIYISLYRVSQKKSIPKRHKLPGKVRGEIVVMESQGNIRQLSVTVAPLKTNRKPIFLMSGTLIFSHNSQNMTYFVTKFGMRKFCVEP